MRLCGPEQQGYILTQTSSGVPRGVIHLWILTYRCDIEPQPPSHHIANNIHNIVVNSWSPNLGPTCLNEAVGRLQ